MKSKKTVKEVLIVFEKAIKDKSWDSWTKLAFLFVIAGETVAEAFKTNEHGRRPEAATELCRGAAEILFSRLVELGSWVSLSVLTLCFILFSASKTSKTCFILASSSTQFL